MGHNHSDGSPPKPKIFIQQPNIGMDRDERHSVIDILTNSLAYEVV